MPSAVFLCLDILSWSSAPPITTIEVSALILSLTSSRSSGRVCVALSPITNKVGVLISNSGSSGSPRVPSKVYKGKPRQIQALIPPELDVGGCVGCMGSLRLSNAVGLVDEKECSIDAIAQLIAAATPQPIRMIGRSL